MITDEDVMNTLRTVVNERPNHVYMPPGATCVYVDNDAPSCLVGHVLNRLGIPLDKLSQYENQEPGQFVHRFGIQPRAIDALNTAQMYQDEGDEWGDALMHAEHIFEIA